MPPEEGTGSMSSQTEERGVTTLERQYREIDPAETPSRRMYGLLTSVVVPRPIAWVSSQSLDGVPNVAPHSYFTVLSHQPPQLGFVSVGEKDTLRNVRETGEYVINVAGEDLAERLNRTAANFPPGESEFTWAGLTPELASKVGAPRVGEAPVSLEMRLTEIKPIGDCFLVIGEVVWVRIAEAVMRDDHVEADLLRALGRHAGPTFSRTVDLFDLQRPTYAGLLEEGAGPMEPASGQ